MFVKTIVNVCAGILAVDEFILVNSIILVVGLTVHIGASAREVPISCAHVEVDIDANETYVENLILILPLDVKGSLIVTLIVYVVILLTTSVPLDVNAPVNVVATAVKL